MSSTVIGFPAWRQAAIDRVRREVSSSQQNAPGNPGGGVLGYLARVGAAPTFLTHAKIREEAARIWDAINSLDDDVRTQFSFISPDELDPGGGAGDGSGYDSGMSDADAKVELKKGGSHKLMAVVMRKRDAGKTATKLALERGFGTGWRAFLKRWSDWAKATLNEPPPWYVKTLIMLGAKPVMGTTAIVGSTQAAWDALDGLTADYQAFYKQFVHDGGTPTRPMAKTPSEYAANPDNPFIPKWVWWVGGGVIVAAAAGYLLSQVGYVAAAFRPATAGTAAMRASYHARMLASYASHRTVP